MSQTQMKETTKLTTAKGGECCAGYGSGSGKHDPSCSATSAATKKAAECDRGFCPPKTSAESCCPGYGSGSGVHDPSCVGMGVSGGAQEKRALSIKDQKSIFNMIVNDHARVNSLFSQFNGTTNKEERNKIAGLIIKEICVHSFLEETILYPVLDKKLNAEGLNMHEHSIQEHQKVKNLLYKLDQNFEPTSESFIATLNETMKHLQHHIDEEENKVLPKLQSKLSMQEELELGASWENRLNTGDFPTRPHPSAPTTEPLASMAAMAAKPLDVARDAARFGSDTLKSLKEAMGGTGSGSGEQQTGAKK